jgi:hypothetical protein
MHKLLAVAMAYIQCGKCGRRMRCGEKNTGDAVAVRRVKGAWSLHVLLVHFLED